MELSTADLESQTDDHSTNIPSAAFTAHPTQFPALADISSSTKGIDAIDTSTENIGTIIINITSIFNSTMVFVGSPSINPGNLTGDNSSQVLSPYPAGLPQIIIFSFLFFVVGSVGIMGNFLVVYAVVCDRQMRRSVTNLLITNLAIADLLIMIFGVPEIVQFMMNRGWVLDPHLCKVNRFILVVSLYASVLTLISICVERYIGIIHPIRAHILCNRRRIGLVVGMVWPASILAGSPTLIFNRVQPGHPELSVQYCMLTFPVDHDFYYLLFKYTEFGLFYIGPLIVQVVLYAIVSRQLFMGSEKLHRRLTVLDENGLAKERSSEALQARKGVVKMLIMSVIVYFISYSPQHVLLIYQTIRTSNFHDTWTVHVLVMIVAYFNSAANPILYSIFSQNFRKNFQLALCAWRLKVRRRQTKREPRRQSTFSNSSRFGRLTSLVPSANTDL